MPKVVSPTARMTFFALAGHKCPASILFMKPNIPKLIIGVKHCMASMKLSLKSVWPAKTRLADTITPNGRIAVRPYFIASFL